MDVVYLIGIILFTIISVLLVWLNLPGSILMFILTLILGFYTGFTVITKKILITILIICIIVELVELLLSGISVKYFGGSRQSAIISIIGGLAGAIIGNFIFPIIGGVIGLFLGSYLMTYINEKSGGKSNAEAMNIAAAATLGNITAKIIKSMTVLLIGTYLSILYIKHIY